VQLFTKTFSQESKKLSYLLSIGNKDKSLPQIFEKLLMIQQKKNPIRKFFYYKARMLFNKAKSISIYDLLIMAYSLGDIFSRFQPYVVPIKYPLRPLPGHLYVDFG
jgi:hypothetical protein